MLKVTSKDFQRNSGYYQDQALKEAVTITHYGRDRLVVINADEYYALRKRARVALPVGEMPESDIHHLEQISMSPKHDHLNDELETKEA
ncbi:MAG: type II toxin-antitoxin system Phd/YefM family antitoxin [Sedimenticola sp.]